MCFLCAKEGHVQLSLSLDDGDDFDAKRLVGMICERLQPVALEILNEVGKSDAQI